MCRESIFRIKGVSGACYEFDEYPLKTSLADTLEILGNAPGVYIFLYSTDDASGCEQRNLLYCGITADIIGSMGEMFLSGIVWRADFLCFAYEPSPFVRCDLWADILLANSFIYNDSQN